MSLVSRCICHHHIFIRIMEDCGPNASSQDTGQERNRNCVRRRARKTVDDARTRRRKMENAKALHCLGQWKRMSKDKDNFSTPNKFYCLLVQIFHQFSDHKGIFFYSLNYLLIFLNNFIDIILLNYIKFNV